MAYNYDIITWPTMAAIVGHVNWKLTVSNVDSANVLVRTNMQRSSLPCLSKWGLETLAVLNSHEVDSLVL